MGSPYKKRIACTILLNAKSNVSKFGGNRCCGGVKLLRFAAAITKTIKIIEGCTLDAILHHQPQPCISTCISLRFLHLLPNFHFLMDKKSIMLI